MRKLSLALLTIGTLLAGCDGGPREYNDSVESAPMAVSADGFTMSKEQSMVAGDQPVAPPPNQSENPSDQSFLAYRYSYSFAIPVKAVSPTARSHMEICRSAGPSICQILSSNTSSASEDHVSAYLRLRAEPKWLEGFKAQIQSSVKDAGGDVTGDSVSAEDLTRSILDTDARLKAQKTLRTRLEGLLETRNAELADLLALERELARVQGQIESATTTLNVLKKRVSMSVVDLNYQTKQSAVSRSAFSPIGQALKNFIREFAYGLSHVIQFFAGFLPWLIFVILPALWLVRWLWRRRKPRPPKKAA